MFAQIEEIESMIYPHVIDEIVDDDRTLVELYISEAESLVRGYLSKRYDVSRLFEFSGQSRNPTVLRCVKVIATWYLINRCNVETLYDKWRYLYEQTIDFLKQVASDTSGVEVTGAVLLTDANGDPLNRIKSGSNTKFTHRF